MTQNFAEAGIFLIQTFASLYLIIVLLRFLMQASRVDYYNPISQAVVKLTDPPVKPLKKILPAVRGVDFATLVVALLVQLLAVCLVMMISGGYVFHPAYVAWSMVGVVSTIFDIYFFALIVMVIGSWIAPYSNHPAMSLVYQLTEPVCAPARKLLPPMGGLDFSIILVFVAITLIDTYLVIRPLAIMLGIPQGLILGL
ncbi:MAG: YggT family protein [Pseudomonadales bacterium]|nr:YggT family protein [Pseudomonadales bacterium]MBO6566748.1 YggT family protein [Pseudomonadales bacterium]MBO6596696.1 YggT family protein [Pseudomonadales bacterium]MBO6655997.1 YggT family protein [Pseudomonadales bacterium]MBO6703367.1 YggT family protein [Pseudomonadales bacterium]